MDSDTLNYRGLLFAYGANAAPFLASIASKSKRVGSWSVPISNNYTPGGGAQTTVSEDTAKSDAAANTVTLAQTYNVCQIQWYHVESTFKKESMTGQFSGLNVDSSGVALSGIAFQKKVGLQKLAKDLEFSLIQGAYTGETDSSTNTKMRGLKNAISTNTVAAGGLKLSKTMIEELVREMVASGAPFTDPVVLCNAFNIQQLSDIYGYAPMDRNMGGVYIRDFMVPGAGGSGILTAMYSPQVPTDEVYIVERDVCAPVFCPVPANTEGIQIGQRFDASIDGVDVGYYVKSQLGAVVGGFLYMQPSFDYGPEMYHGSVTGLATSA
ncbi:DUF5309 domain-containing protein [Patescibacteria group bacterium]|nr:DUF5309 domain-containing protein [Patescibacteria group bacterium]